MYLSFRGYGDKPFECPITHVQQEKMFVTNCQIHGDPVWKLGPNR